MKITNANFNKKSVTYTLPENILSMDQSKKVDSPSFETPTYQFWFQDEDFALLLHEAEFCVSCDMIRFIRFNVKYDTDITATLSYEPDFDLLREDDPCNSIEDACALYLDECNKEYEVELTSEEKSIFLNMVTSVEKQRISCQIHSIHSCLKNLISPWEDDEGYVYSLDKEDRKAYTAIAESLWQIKNELDSRG